MTKGRGLTLRVVWWGALLLWLAGCSGAASQRLSLTSVSGDGEVIQGENFPGLVARCSSSGNGQVPVADVVIQRLGEPAQSHARLWLSQNGSYREVPIFSVSTAELRYFTTAFSLNIAAPGVTPATAQLETTVDGMTYQRTMTCEIRP